MFDDIIIKEMSSIDAYNYGRQMMEKELNEIHLCELKQIRADAIEECIYWLETHCMANNYKGIPTEDIRGVLEELKEHNNGKE